MDEFALIERYFSRARTDASVRVGIGDDGAVLLPAPGSELVVATDTLVEGVHYPNDVDPADVGYRAVMVNLSDFAAMGATPRWMTMALSLPETSAGWLDGFAEGLFEAAGKHDVMLVGGDTTRSDSIVISLQVIGEVTTGDAILRSGARPGDRVCVTGHPGDAAAGLDLFHADDQSDYLRARFLRPEARVDYGVSLCGTATSAIDISDGLYADLGKLLAASACGARLDLDRLPVSAELAARYPRPEQLRFALGGGDDYELCFTAPAGDLPSAAHAVTVIGEVTDGEGIDCFENGKVVDFTDTGYRHFA